MLFADVTSEADFDFDKEDFGESGAMIFTNTAFKDREFMRRLLLTGRSRIPVNSCVDNYNVPVSTQEADTKRKKRIKPSKPQVMQVLKAAFQQFPRLGTVQDSDVFFQGLAQLSARADALS